VDHELGRLNTSLRERAAAPQLAELHRLGLALAQEEADRTLARLGLLSDLERQIVRDAATRLVRRVLYRVSRRLREDVRSHRAGASSSATA
jgi:glutamyl-tRNA reductase